MRLIAQRLREISVKGVTSENGWFIWEPVAQTHVCASTSSARTGHSNVFNTYSVRLEPVEG
jgi:hypothetical protein